MCAGELAQLRQRDVDHRLGIGASPGGDQPGSQQQGAGQLQRVVEPLGLGAVVFLAGLLAEGFQDGADDGGALGGEVAADAPRAAERGPKSHGAVVRVGVVGVGLLCPPRLDRAHGDGGEVVGGRSGRGGVKEDAIGLVAHLGGKLAGPVGDGEGEGVGDVTGGQGVPEQRPTPQLAHLPHRGRGAHLRHARLRGQPR